MATFRQKVTNKVDKRNTANVAYIDFQKGTGKKDIILILIILHEYGVEGPVEINAKVLKSGRAN